MATRKRKGGKITNKTRRNIERRLRNVDSSEEGIRASQLVLTKQQQRASEVLDAAVNATAKCCFILPIPNIEKLIPLNMILYYLNLIIFLKEILFEFVS